VVVGGKNALVFDVKNGIQVAELKHEWHLTSVAISKLGDIVITADEKREIRVWSVKKQVVFTQFKVSEDVSSIKFSPDEKYFTVEGQAGWSRVYSKNDNSQDS
jgi:WD40 repeat protein